MTLSVHFREGKRGEDILSDFVIPCVRRTAAVLLLAVVALALTPSIAQSQTPDPLSATISGQETYKGSAFAVKVKFNYPIDTAADRSQAARDFKEHSLDVENGTIHFVAPRGELGKEFVVTIISTDSHKDVVITLNSGIACGQTGAMCTTVSNTVFPLSNTPIHTVQRVPPAIDQLRITSVPNNGVAYRLGERITATVRFDEPIAVVAGSTPVLMLEFPGAIKKSAVYSGTGTGTFAYMELDFTYEVALLERHSGVGIAANALDTNPFTAFASSGGKSDLHPNSLASDAVSPNSQMVDGRVRILDVAITSDPGTDLTYHKGDQVEVTVTFARAVEAVASILSWIKLTLENPASSGIASSTVNALYSNDDASESQGVLKYYYEVAADDTGLQGISIPENPISVHVLVMGDFRNINYDFAGLATNVLHKVDGSAPAMTNTPATGAVTIEGTDVDGTVRVDYTLSADTSGIMDVNGVPAMDEYEYEWLRSGVLISGAEASDYTVVDADLGETLSVRVKFTDSAGFSESVRSAETSSVIPVILDHDPVLTIANASADEEDGEITFTVTLSEVHGLEVSVDYVTVDATELPSLEAVAGDDFDATNGVLTFAPGELQKTITVTIIEDLLIEADTERFAVELVEPFNAVLGNVRALGTIRDSDEAEWGMTVDLTEISEASGSATVTVSITNGVVFERDQNVFLSYPPTAKAMRRGVEVGPRDDYTASDVVTLTAGLSTVEAELNAIQDTVYEGNESIVVTVYQIGSSLISNLQTTVTIIDDDEVPVATLQLSPDSIAENGGVSMVTATLSHASSRRTKVTVSAAVSLALASDFTLSDNTTLTIAANKKKSSGTVTITAVNNDIHDPNKTVTVSGSAAGGSGITAPSDETLTIVDDEDPPTVTLHLSQSLITENQGVSTVTARLSHPSNVATTVTVSAAAVLPALAADFTLSDTTTLTIDAGDTSSTGTVTVTAVNNDVDDSNNKKRVTVSGSATGGPDIAAPSDKTLTIVDDESRPSTELHLTPDSIGEDGGSSTVTATLSHPSNLPAIVQVFATAVHPTRAADFALQSDNDFNFLTIAPGDTQSTGTVTITARNNSVDAPDKTVSVSGGTLSANLAPEVVTLTIEDDEDEPTVTLQLSTSLISENGGMSTVTATLSHRSSADTQVTISEIEGGVTLSDNKTLTIAAGDTQSTGTVTITAVDNNIYEMGSVKSVMVTAVADNYLGVVQSSPVRLRIVDNERMPTATLHLTPNSIGEKGGSSTLTATLSHASIEATTITVSAVAGLSAVEADFVLSENKSLTIAPRETQSTGTVTIIAIDNNIDSRNKTVIVGGQTLSGVNLAAHALTIEDDEKAPTATLHLTSPSIGEDGGSSTVTATLSHPSSEATTLTVSAAGANAADADFTLSDNSTLTIDAGDTSSTGTVTIAAVNNGVDAPDKEVTVSASVANTQGVTAPTDLTLAIEDDEQAPTVTLHLSKKSIGENGGSSTVTATLSHPSSNLAVVRVFATGVFPTRAADFALSDNNLLTIAPGDTQSTRTVTIIAIDNDIDAPDKTVSVNASNTLGVNAPADLTLTIEDDDEAPTVTLILTPSSISENGGSSTVTAELSHASSAETTVTVSAAAGAHATDGDFTLSGTELMIAAGNTTSTGTVTISAVDNDADEPNKEVTVSASADNTQGVNAPASVTLTLTDDEGSPTVTLILTPESIGENGESSAVTATLSHTSSADTMITVSAAAGDNAADADFTLSGTTLTIASGLTTSTGTVTIAAVNNGVDAPDKEVTVAASASNTLRVNAPADLTLTIKDDDEAPTVTLHLSPKVIDEDGGVSTVTARLSHPSSVVTTVTVVAAAVSPTAETDFALSDNKTLTIAAGATTSTGVVKVTAVGNGVDAPDKKVTVSGSAAGGTDIASPSNKTLTIVDNEGLPTAKLHLTSPSIGEDGGSSTVTATLSHPTNSVAVVRVFATKVFPTRSANFALSDNKLLLIAPGETQSTGTVTITAIDNNIDAPDKKVSVSGQSLSANHAPEVVTLTIEDDEQAPTVTLQLSPTVIDEDGGVSTVTATLSHRSSTDTQVKISEIEGVFTLSDNKTLTIAARNTQSTGTVTVTAVDNNVYETDIHNNPIRSVMVTAVADNDVGVVRRSTVELMIRDDEDVPTLRLHLAPDSIGENRGSSTVTATLSHASDEATTITVSAAQVAPAVAADFELSADTTLTIAAGATTSTGTVTIVAVDNTSDDPNKQVTVSASAAITQGVNAPADLTLTIVDDEGAPTATLILTPDSIGENGGSSTVTATLSHASDETITITLSAEEVAPAVAADFVLSADTTLTIAAGATTSTGTVTIDAIDNTSDDPNKQVTVSASVASTQGVNAPADLTLTIVDDEGAPTATPESTGENGGLRAATALSHASDETNTITLSAEADFELSADTILTTENDEGEPTATLILTPSSISENGGSSTVTAELSHASRTETTLTVSVTSGANTVPEDFKLSANTTLTIASGATTSTGTVTIEAIDNDVDAPDKSLIVSASVGNLVNAPEDLMLTIFDDEGRLLAVKALLTRIGRTASFHVVDALGTRMRGTKSGSNVTLAGQRLPFGDTPLPQANAFVGQGPGDAHPYNYEWNQISGEQEDLQKTSVRSITSREMLAGSSFSLRLAEDDDESKNTGKWTAWGLTEQSSFDGRDGNLLLNGDVTTVIVGVDAELQQTMAGVAVAHSSGDSAFEENGACDGPRCKGTLKTRLTGVYPYLRHDVNERLLLSGVLGYAKGDLAYSGDSVAGIESGTAAFSARGTLQPVPSENGFELAARLDVFLNWVRTEETANLEAIKTDTNRLRLALEASRTLALDTDRTLTSTIQLGLRQDGGDAEIGQGVDVNAALRYADPARGLSVEGAIHRLISHEDADYEEQGVSASVRLDPDAAGLGLSLSLASSWSAGATRTNPWSILNAENLSENSNFNSAVHLDAELGYGLATFGNQSVHTPYFGFSLSKTGETTQRLGWRLRTGSDFTLKLETARHHQSDGETPNSFGLQISTPW